MVPSDVKLHRASAILELRYEDGRGHELSAEYLRVYSPSAEVQGHSPDQAVLQHGKRDVKITDVIPQGHYAIKLVFSDGHDSGIFSWDYLFDLGNNFEHHWADYLQRLEQAGKKRESQFIAISR